MKSPSLPIVCCSLLGAALVLASAYYQGLPDPDDYRVYAEKYAARFFDRGHNPDSYRPPLYPIVLAPIVRFAATPKPWIALLHALLTVAILAATWRIARRFANNCFLPTVACLLVAVDPILVFESGQIMTETIFTALLLWMLVPWLAPSETAPVKAPLNGLLAGLAFLTRPTVAPLFAAVGVTRMLQRDRVRTWLAAALVAVAVVLPWAFRNKWMLGAMVVATTHGGYTLWLANNPSFYRHEVLGRENWAGSESFDRWQNRNAALTAGESELGKDEYFRNAALGWIRAHPADAAHAALYRLSLFWGLQPRTGPAALRPLIGIYYFVLFALAPVGWFLLRSWRGPWLTATLVVVALSLVHTVYWSNMRFRAPIEPLLAIWAAVALDRLWKRLRSAT